jgi:hypothetical protein
VTTRARRGCHGRRGNRGNRGNRGTDADRPARDENLIADLTVVEVKNGPHNIGWTHPEETNAAILAFLSGTAKADIAPPASAPVAAASTY